MKPFPIRLGLFLGVVTIATTAQAQNYPWCANFADGAGVNCGFSSYEQCMETSRGSGGYCTPNNLYTPPRAAPPSRHSTRKHPSQQKSRPFR
jgi:hypothetical protein